MNKTGTPEQKQLGCRSVQHVATHASSMSRLMRDIQQTPQPLASPPLPRRLTCFPPPPYTPRLETHTAKRCDGFAVVQQTSSSPPFPQTPDSGPVSVAGSGGRVVAGRAADFAPRLVSAPGGARFEGPPRYSTRVSLRVRRCASGLDTLAGAVADAGTGCVAVVVVVTGDGAESATGGDVEHAA